MASIHKRDSTENWYCAFTDSNGRRRYVSTKTGDKLEAQAFCLRMETLAKQTAAQASATVSPQDTGELVEAGLRLLQTATSGALSEAVGIEYVNRLLKASGAGSEIKGETVKDFFANWLAGKELSQAKNTGLRYKSAVSFFIQSLGKRAKLPLSAVGAKDIEAFRDSRLKLVGASTVSDDMKIISSAFNRARRQGAIQVNPSEAVDIPASVTQTKEPFTASEVKILLAIAPSEWKTPILLAFYAGLRLGDAVRLDWQAVDFTKGLLTFRAQKTKRKKKGVESIPLHPTLRRHLEKIAGDTGGAISPKLAGQAIDGRSGLSRQFSSIVNQAGLGAPEGEKLEGNRRRFTSKTFHSLRHGFVSAMANEGVSKELRMKLAGHTSEDVATGYTHHEMARLSEAINTIK
jgi:integrase